METTTPLDPAARAEIDAILATVPRSVRSHAMWAVPLLLGIARANGMAHPRRIAYLLATAHYESGFGARLEEQPAAAHSATEEMDFARYEPGTPGGNALGNGEAGDGRRFRGRGFVWVRGRSQYATWSRRLDFPECVVDGAALPFFVVNPDVMARPDIAARTLVRGMRDGIFTGVALGSHVNDRKTDYMNARRVIGGTAAARDVAKLAALYATAIENAGAEAQRIAISQLSIRGASTAGTRDFLADVGQAVERLGWRGDRLPPPAQVIDWNGEARTGKFAQIDDHTFGLHIGRGVYVILDIERDLNGIAPPQATSVALKRSGDVVPIASPGQTEL